MINVRKSSSFAPAPNGSVSKYPFLWRKLESLWLTSKGPSGDRITDYSGRFSRASLSGFSSTPWARNPAYGCQLDFDGTNDYVDCGSVIPESTSKFSVSIWCKFDSLSADHCLVSRCNAGASLTNGILIFGDDVHGPSGRTDCIAMVIGTGVGNESIATASGTKTTNPTHIVCTFNEGISKIYINGNLDPNFATLSMSTIGASLSSFRIGRRSDQATYMDGLIGDVMVWTRDLQPYEVQILFRNGSPLDRKVYTIGKAGAAITLSPDPAIITWTVSTPSLNQSASPASAVTTWTVPTPALTQQASPASAVVTWTVSNPGISNGSETTIVPPSAMVTWTVGTPVVTLIPSVWDDCCNVCDVPSTTTDAGPQGPSGAAGATGADGVSAYTTVASYIPSAQPVVPAYGSNLTLTVANSTWMQLGQPLFISSIGYFEVQSKPSSTTVILKNIATSAGAYSINVAPGTTIPASAVVSPGGIQGPDQTTQKALYSGNGSPEGVIIATVGSLYTDLLTGNLYTKVSGTGDTGWV